MTYIHQYSIWNSFIAVTILCALFTLLYLTLQPLISAPAPTDVFIVSKILPFLEYCIVKVLQCTAFPDWLFHLVIYI